MGTGSRNAMLKTHLAELEAYTHAAKTASDISIITDKIKHFSQQHHYKYNQALPSIGLILAALAGALSYWKQLHVSEDARLFLLIFAIVMAGASIVVIGLRLNKIKSLSALIYFRSVAIKAEIQRDYNFNGKVYWKELSNTFALFNCGNESQEITKRYNGAVNHLDDKGQTPFTLFEFKYVVVTTHVSTDSRGRAKTSQNRTTKYKYGLLFHMPEFNYLSINAPRFEQKWDSTSVEFNKLFKIRCADAIRTAKFFDPKTVLAFSNRFSFVKTLDVTRESKVCIELPKEVFPSHLKSPSLRKHTQFIDSVKNPASIPMLEKSKELVQIIVKQK